MGRAKHKRKAKKIYSVIVDGQTEVWYLQMMKRHENLPRIDVKPELPKKKKLAEQFKTVLSNAIDYDKVIWVLDLDTIIKETTQVKKGQKSSLQLFREYLSKLKRYKNVEVIVNTPCLEFWFLLHFSATGKYFSTCEPVEKQLKQLHLVDYEKTEKYFKKYNDDIYLKLKALQRDACENAKRLGAFNIEDCTVAKSEMYKLLEVLEVMKS